jgi:hypothetical protein
MTYNLGWRKYFIMVFIYYSPTRSVYHHGEGLYSRVLRAYAYAARGHRCTCGLDFVNTSELLRFIILDLL